MIVVVQRFDHAGLHQVQKLKGKGHVWMEIEVRNQVHT